MTIANNISFKDNAGFTNLLDIIYPIGSCYMSVSSDSPAVKFGGTWTQVTDSLIAASGSSYSSAASSWGGDHTIKERHTPPHEHWIAINHDISFVYSFFDTATNKQYLGTPVSSTTSGATYKKWIIPDGAGYYINGTDSLRLKARTKDEWGGADFIPYHYSVNFWVRTA